MTSKNNPEICKPSSVLAVVVISLIHPTLLLMKPPVFFLALSVTVADQFASSTLGLRGAHVMITFPAVCATIVFQRNHLGFTTILAVSETHDHHGLVRILGRPQHIFRMVL
jgi:hypothetical protein